MKLAKNTFLFFYHAALPILLFAYGFHEGRYFEAKRAAQPVAQFSISRTLN